MALCSVIGLAACGTSTPRAPSTGPKIPSYNPQPVSPRWHWVPLPGTDLPLTQDASRLGSATGLGGLDGYDRYREVALAGRRGEPPADLIKAEAAALRRRGWRLGSSIVIVGPRPGFKPVPISTPGAIVSFNGPRHHEWISLSVYTTFASVYDDIGPPLDAGRKIRDALRGHRPVLDLNSAQRSYKPVPENELS